MNLKSLKKKYRNIGDVDGMGLALRIDRVARRAHAFHRFAHHPLCAAYRGEVVVIRRRLTICKECTLAALGAGVGLLLALLRPPASAGLVGLFVALILVVGPWRLPKALSRFVPAALVTASFGGGAVAGAAAAVVAGAALVLYRRRGPFRGPCRDCPEAHAAVCSGFAPMVRRERAFQRLVGRWLRPSSAVQHLSQASLGQESA